MKNFLLLLLLAVLSVSCANHGEKLKYLLSKYKRVATVSLGGNLAPDHFLVETEDGKYLWIMPSFLLKSGEVPIFSEIPVGWSQK